MGYPLPNVSGQGGARLHDTGQLTRTLMARARSLAVR